MQLNDDDLDALCEIVNIGVGRAANSLSELIGARIDLRVPVLKLVETSDADKRSQAGISIVQSFSGDVSGNALLVFPTESGNRLGALLGDYPVDDEVPLLELTGILAEVGNIVLNGVLGSLSNAMETDFLYTVPDFYIQETIASMLARRNDESVEKSNMIVLADTKFCVKSEDIEGSVIVAFHLGALDSLCERLAILHGC